MDKLIVQPKRADHGRIAPDVTGHLMVLVSAVGTYSYFKVPACPFCDGAPHAHSTAGVRRSGCHRGMYNIVAEADR